MIDDEEEMFWQMNPMERLKRRCESEKKLGGCHDKAIYEAWQIEAAEEADDLGDRAWEEDQRRIDEQVNDYCDASDISIEDLERDIVIDTAIENKHMCENADKEEAYWNEVRRKELETLQEKLDNMD